MVTTARGSAAAVGVGAQAAAVPVASRPATAGAPWTLPSCWVQPLAGTDPEKLRRSATLESNASTRPGKARLRTFRIPRFVRVPKASGDLIFNMPGFEDNTHYHRDFPKHEGPKEPEGKRITGDWFVMYSSYWRVKVGWS